MTPTRLYHVMIEELARVDLDASAYWVQRMCIDALDGYVEQDELWVRLILREALAPFGEADEALAELMSE